MKHARILYDGAAQAVAIGADGSVRTSGGVQLDPDNIRWLPPIHRTVFCVALNYAAHIALMEASFYAPPYREPPKTPVLFIKPENTISPHRAAVPVPEGVAAIQPGPALALVIGRRTRRIRADAAFDYIKGYTLFNDFSLPEESYFRPPIKTKCRDGFGPLGPCIVDRGDVPDPHALRMRVYVNNDVRQEARTSDLVWRIPALIESISAFMTLEEDDIIATGFPPGRVDVRPGDAVTVEIDAVGRLDSTIMTADEYYSLIHEGRAVA